MTKLFKKTQPILGPFFSPLISVIQLYNQLRYKYLQKFTRYLKFTKIQYYMESKIELQRQKTGIRS